MFWMLLAMLVFTYVVGQLLAPKPKDAAAPNLGEIQPPHSEKGIPIPVIFGTQKVAPNVFWWGNVHADPVTERVKTSIFNTGKHVIVGYTYGADIAGALCHGPIDELLDVMFQDQSVMDYQFNNPNMVQDGNGYWISQIPIAPALPMLLPGAGPSFFRFNAPEMFGGQQQQGGIVAKFDFYWGTDTQPYSANLATKGGLSSQLSDYKGLCWFFTHDATYGTSPSIRPFYCIIRRCPFLVSPDVATANINGSANPADAIYEILTNSRWGLGLASGAIDVASLAAAAVTLKAEGMGIDLTLNSQDAAETIIGEILRHVDGVLFSHPTSGLLTIKLIRADYVEASLPHLNPSNTVKLTEYKKSSWPETFNEVKVNYIERGGYAPYVFPYLFRTDVQQAQNLASLQAMGEVASTTLSFNYFSTPALAMMAAFRTLRVASEPLASMTLTVNRKLSDLTIGSLLVVDWPPLGISNMVVRVVTMKFGTLTNNNVELSVVEDVFATAPPTFTPVPGSVWLPPSLQPTLPLVSRAMPAPYFLTKADAFVGVNMVARGKKTSVTWDGYFTDNPTVPDTPASTALITEDNQFVPVGTLVAALRWNSAYQASGIVLNDYQDMDKTFSATPTGFPGGESLAVIYGGGTGAWEIIAFETIVFNANGTYTINNIMRGQMDTLPIDHPIGSMVFFFTTKVLAAYWPGFPAAPPTASGMTASTSGYKGWVAANGIAGRRAPELPFKIEQTGAALTDPRRAVMPYPPGGLRLNGVNGNVVSVAIPIAGTSISVTWNGRNRLTETAMRLHDATGTVEEAGTLYRAIVEWVNRATGAVIYPLRTDDPVTTPYVYTNMMLEWDLMEANGGTALPGGAANRTNGGLRIKIQSYTSTTLKSMPVAVPGFSPDQLAGYPIVPSVVYAAAATLPLLSDVTDLYAWYSAAPDGPNVYAGAEPVKTVTTLVDMHGGLNSAITGTVKRVRNTLNHLPVFDFSTAGLNYAANVSVPLKGSMTWFGVIRYSALGVLQQIFDAFPTGTPMDFYVDAINNLTNSIAGAGSAQANNWITCVVHLTQVNPTTANFKLRVNGANIINTNFTAGTSPVTATGGTVVVAGGYTIHTFTANGTFTITAPGSIEALIIGGGGGGGWGSGQRTGGGGGGGGFLEVSATPMANGSYAVVVGAGGVANTNGGNSSFNGQVAIGGGQGGGNAGNGVAGGSGGGARHGGFGGGAPTAGQGFVGGPGGYDSGSGVGVFTGSGGGGAGGAGAQGISTTGGVGGPAKASLISGVSTLYSAGGGGAAGNFGGQTVPGGAGGSGMGGVGGTGLGTGGGTGTPGTGGNAVGANNGSGGGGGSNDGVAGSASAGVVIIRYANSAGSGAVPGTPSVPSAQIFNLFNKSGLVPFKGLIAEQGIYAAHRDGSEAVLEAYLRAKFATW